MSVIKDLFMVIVFAATLVIGITVGVSAQQTNLDKIACSVGVNEDLACKIQKLTNN